MTKINSTTTLNPRLGFPCSYDDDAVDPAAAAAAWSVALPRRRVKQACLSCHSRKARCSGHMPACDRCRAQGIECIYRPTRRARVSHKSLSAGRNSPLSHDEDHRDDVHNESDPGYADLVVDGPSSANDTYHHHHHRNRNHGSPSSMSRHRPTHSMADADQDDMSIPDQSFDALIGRTFEKFFRHVHHIPAFSFLHRASLVEQYHLGNVDKTLLLALVGITSCLTDMGPGMRAYGARCVDEAEHLILSDYARPSTIKVQALVFMIKHRILSNRFPSAFMLIGIASRFAAALRLNYEAPNVCFLAQESRRRLMWAIYTIDSSVSGGHRDFSLWRAERIFVGLPCNERNFEFDLPQDTEGLIPDSDQRPPSLPPQPPHAEDVGSLALHIRIQYIRHKISEFTKEAVANRNVHPSSLQTRVLSLHHELDEFAAHLPASFQFSENSLRLRAYSPRICVFVMIHVWWRQCHCDLYRLGLIGLREALPGDTLDRFDESFIEHCQRQCVDHATAMASIFSSMQKLNARPVADLDLAICAYQCARMLKYAYHANSGRLNLPPEVIIEQFKVCLQTIKDCCTGTAAAGIRTDLERLISDGLGPRVMPAAQATPPPDPHRNTRSTALVGAFSKDASPADAGDMMTDDFDASAAAASTPGGTTTPGAGGQDVPSELNNAFEGAMDSSGLDNGLDFGMGFDVNLWTPTPTNGEWSTTSSMNL
ncbi:Fungal trans [Geosmithia morbida]|uniref:Fungal trans n=1 Tax=Geosmithia morbida TaxID=1094350 RepID=A0A9P4YRW7_9HYPO|nr:Fungal trans [Geosmithia morbida]KAF4120712.1 Fungal trans [Geosmithia morbida]